MIGDFVRYKGNIYEASGPFGKDKKLFRVYSSDPKDAAYGFEPSKADGEYTKLIPLSEVTEYYSEYPAVIYKGRCFSVLYEDEKKHFDESIAIAKNNHVFSKLENLKKLIENCN